MSTAPGEVGGPQGLLAALQDLHVQAGRPSSRAIANAIGVSSHSTVAELLRGKRTPSQETLQRLVHYLGGDEERFLELLRDANDKMRSHRFPSEEDSAFIEKYKVQLDYVHGRWTLPTFESRTVALFEKMFVPPRLTDGSGEVGLSFFVPRIKRTVLLGEPGSGKTVTAQYVLRNLATLLPSFTPFMIHLREWARLNRGTFEQQIEETLESVFQLRPPAEFVSRALQSDMSLVVLDGLDELADREQAVNAIEAFAIRFPHTRILVTARTNEYLEHRLDPGVFDWFALSPFDEAQVADFMARWFSVSGGNSDLEGPARKAILQQGETEDLISNPLMLAMLCTFYQERRYVPRNRVEAVASYIDVYLHRWDQLRGISFPTWNGLRIQRLLEDVAAALDESGRDSLQEVELLEIIDANSGSASDGPALDLARYLMGRTSIFSDCGVSDTGQLRFSFTARTWQDYFAARALLRRNKSAEMLASALSVRIASSGLSNVELFVLDIARNTFESSAVDSLVDTLVEGASSDGSAKVRLKDWLTVHRRR